MKKIIALVVVLMLAVFVFAGCQQTPQPAATSSAPSASVSASESPSQAASSQPATGKKPNVLFVNVGSNIAYPAAEDAVFKELCAKKGWDFSVLDGQLDAAANVKNLEQAAAMKPDAVICMLMDATVQSNAIRKVCEAGIPLILDTGRPNPDDRKYANCYTGVDDITAGKEAAELMNEALGGKGNIVVIQGISGQQTVVDRNQGFNDKLKELNSEIKTLAVLDGDWSKETGTKNMEDFLTRFGDKINGVFCHDDESAAGAALALKEANIPQGKIKIVGTGGSKTGLAGVKAGDIYGTTYQSPRATMTKSIEAVQYILDNKIKAGQALDPYFQYIELPKVTAANVDQFLPGEW